ncbi:hypothetical protein ACFX10_022283 [Malus domestica]
MKKLAHAKGKMSSVVQMRGSIPLFGSQEASRFSLKPDIILQRYDPTYQATKLHFEDMAMRYGNEIWHPVILLNLIKGGCGYEDVNWCEVYGKIIGSYLPKDSPLRQDPAYYVLKEDKSPSFLDLLRSRDGWISFLALMAQVRVLQEFLHSSVIIFFAVSLSSLYMAANLIELLST